MNTKQLTNILQPFVLDATKKELILDLPLTTKEVSSKAKCVRALKPLKDIYELEFSIRITFERGDTFNTLTLKKEASWSIQ